MFLALLKGHSQGGARWSEPLMEIQNPEVSEIILIFRNTDFLKVHMGSSTFGQIKPKLQSQCIMVTSNFSFFLSFMVASKFLGSTIENHFGFTSHIEQLSSVPDLPSMPIESLWFPSPTSTPVKLYNSTVWVIITLTHWNMPIASVLLKKYKLCVIC